MGGISRKTLEIGVKTHGYKKLQADNERTPRHDSHRLQRSFKSRARKEPSRTHEEDLGQKQLWQDHRSSAHIALIQYEDGEKRYILAPNGLSVGDTVCAGAAADIKPGNALPLINIPVGTFIHNIELYPGKGAQLVRAAGNMAQLMGREGDKVLVRLPSGEMRYIPSNCMATVGQVGNIDHENVHIGKAGRKRHMGVRPTVRGSVMNPCDHPHGGGEGKSPVGHPSPVTPWGKPALGYKTRAKHNRSDKYIVKRRNAK